MAKIADKDSKARILEAFRTILEERKRLNLRVATREEEVEKEQKQAVVATASQYTIDSIVRGLADLQLTFSNVITDLSTRLTRETDKLEELQRAIAH